MKPRKLFLLSLAILFCVTLAAAQSANAPTPTPEKKHAPKAGTAVAPSDTKEINDRLATLTDSVTELKSRVDKLTELQTNAELKAKVDALSGRLSNEFWITMCIAALLAIVLVYAVRKFLPAMRNVVEAQENRATTQSVTDLQGALEQSITQTGTDARASLAQLAQGVADARAEQRLAMTQLTQSVADARAALVQSINESRLAQQQALAQLVQSVADARAALAQSVNEARVAQQQALEQLIHSARH
jgi:tetrahydromethanopterin S-methyltransferase subunit B